MTAINQVGVRVAFVHMAEEAQVAPLMAEHDLGPVSRVSDPDRKLYAAFGLGRGGARALIGPKVWACGIKAGLAGHFPHRPVGDVRQMPGVFLVHKGKILHGFRASTIADKPDLESFLRVGLESIVDETN